MTISEFGNFGQLTFMNRYRTINLLELSLDRFTKCLNKNVYKTYFDEFAKIYFNHMKDENYLDEVLGVMNPYFILIYHNDAQLLRDTLKSKGYIIDYRRSKIIFIIKLN